MIKRMYIAISKICFNILIMCFNTLGFLKILCIFVSALKIVLRQGLWVCTRLPKGYLESRGSGSPQAHPAPQPSPGLFWLLEGPPWCSNPPRPARWQQ